MPATTLVDVFAALTTLLRKHRLSLRTVHDTAEQLYLECPVNDAKGKPVFFAAVKIGKGQVAFHLMPVYTHPELLNSISSALKQQMQGKSCFNFKSLDTELFAELATLVSAAFAMYKKLGKI
jgi:hypothetical protein